MEEKINAEVVGVFPNKIKMKKWFQDAMVKKQDH